MRLKAKIDNCQLEIVRNLRDIGADVLSLANIGNGAPDLLVYYHKYYLFELKSDKGKLTPHQGAFHSIWRGPIHVVHNFDEVLRVLNNSTRGKAHGDQIQTHFRRL